MFFIIFGEKERCTLFYRVHELTEGVACGRNSESGVVLHIDHIIPRSKGGQDHIDNYQTLCDTCNIGKSNRDQTDLRAKLK